MKHFNIAISIIAMSIPLMFIMFFISASIALYTVPVAIIISLLYLSFSVLYRVFTKIDSANK